MQIDATLDSLQGAEPLTEQGPDNPREYISSPCRGHCRIARGIDPAWTIRSINDCVGPLQNHIDTETLCEITGNVQTLCLHRSRICLQQTGHFPWMRCQNDRYGTLL